MAVWRAQLDRTKAMSTGSRLSVSCMAMALNLITNMPLPGLKGALALGSLKPYTPLEEYTRKAVV